MRRYDTFVYETDQIEGLVGFWSCVYVCVCARAVYTRNPSHHVYYYHFIK